jgi:hypothetical protein
MTQVLGGVMRMFRLTDETDGLGLSCTPAGVSLAGVPLLRRTQAGFKPRPASEIASLLKAAYGDDPTGLQSRLGAIAQALNSGDFTKAMIAAVHTRTPELSPEAALRLANADEELTKYNYNPDELRDRHGRWTTGSESITAPRNESEQGAEPYFVTESRRVAENTRSDATALSDSDDGDAAGEPPSLEQTFEREYDDLGPVDFAKRVIQFGDWLGRAGGNLSPAEMGHALAEYSFLQDRLSFWLAYDYKPPTAQGNLLSAALTLYQGAVNGGIVRVGHLPQSMVDVVGVAAAFTDGPPRRPSTEPVLEEAPVAPAQAPKEIEGLGGTVDKSETEIEWHKGIKDQNAKWEDYYDKVDTEARRLRPGSKGFDHFNDDTGEAISNKTLNTLTVSRIKNPQKIFEKVAGYVNDAVNYVPRTKSEVASEKILSKTIHLAIPEYTSPTQWRYLLRVIIYGEDNGVSVVITRIRE